MLLVVIWEYSLVLDSAAWEPVCVVGCGGDTSPPAPREYIQPPTTSPEELERQRLERESNDVYNKGLQCGDDHDCAINKFKEALRLNPDNRKARIELGLVLNRKAHTFYEKHDWTRAVEYYKEALLNKPDDNVIRENLRNAEEKFNLEKKWQAREAERARYAAVAKIKIDKMLDDLGESPSSQTGSLSFPDASSPKSLEFPEPSQKGLKIKEVPSPYGYTSKQEREAQLKMLTLLSKEHLNKRIERTTRALEFMKSDFSGVEKTLNELVSEARDAEEQALLVSFKALAGAALKIPKIKKADAKTVQRIRDLAGKGLKVLDYVGPIEKLNEDPLDREANLEMARNLTGELHSILEEYGEAYFNKKVATELGTELTGFGGFIVDYTYEAGRWAVAGSQIKSIIDNLDRPGGKLDAQLSLKRTLEDLMSEKNRRKAGVR